MDQTTVETERKKQKYVGYVLKKGKWPGRMVHKTGILNRWGRGEGGGGEANEKVLEGKTQKEIRRLTQCTIWLQHFLDTLCFC